MATTLLTVPRAAKRTMTLSWRLEDAWSPEGDGCYDVTYTAQPTIRATKLRVAVMPPDGYSPREAGDDAAADGALHTGAVEGCGTAGPATSRQIVHNAHGPCTVRTEFVAGTTDGNVTPGNDGGCTSSVKRTRSTCGN